MKPKRQSSIGAAQKVRGVIAAQECEAARLRVWGARRARRMWAGALLVFGGSMAAMFQSCSGAGGAKLADQDRSGALVAKAKPRPAAGAGGRGKVEDNAAMERSAKELEAMLARMHAEEEAKATERPESSEPEPIAPVAAVTSAPPVVKPVAPLASGAGAANVGASLDEPAADAARQTVELPIGEGREAKSVAVRRAELASELAALLRPVAVDGSDSLSALAPMLALEAVQPGAATAEIEAAVKTLTPEEGAAVRSVRELLRKIGADPQLAADPRALSRELGAQMDHLAAHAPSGGLALGTVALCSRVESFGRYTPLASSRMLAGKTNSAIVYAEVSNFVQRPAHEAVGAAQDGRVDQEGSLIVQMEEEVELWHDDGSLQWRAPRASIRDSSRTRRHDFFLVQRIDLPPNLSVGKYNLKVTVRDAGAEGSPQTEVMIPIEIIADPRVAVGGKEPRKSGEDEREKALVPGSPPPTPSKMVKPTGLRRDEGKAPVVRHPSPPLPVVRPVKTH